MTDSIRMPVADAVPRWAKMLLALVAALELLDGASNIATGSLFPIVQTALALAALGCAATSRIRYALLAMAALVLLRALFDLLSGATDGEAGVVTAFRLVVAPLLGSAVALLAWKQRNLTLATLLATLPTLCAIVFAFVLGAVMSGY